MDAAGRDDRGDPGGPTAPARGQRPGLRAEYFEGRTFDAPGAVRVDPAVDFEWPPAPRPIARTAARGAVAVALDLPAGRYRAEWVDPKTGRALRGESLEHAGGRKSLTSPAFDEDSRWPSAPGEREHGRGGVPPVAGTPGVC